MLHTCSLIHTHAHTTGFAAYAFFAISLSIYLIFVVAPSYGQTNILVYIAICSLIGSLSVMGCKGLSIAIKLTFMGQSQLQNPLTWFFLVAVAVCISIQMNYLNKALDIFNTSLVTPIYYVMFTMLTILASAILFREWTILTTTDVIGALCGFATIVCGVFLLHAFKDVHFTLRDLINLTNRQNGESGHTEGPQGDGLARQGSSTALQMEPTSSRRTRSNSNRHQSSGGSLNPNHSETASEEDELFNDESRPFVQQNHVS